MAYQGDIALGSTIDFHFTTVDATGAPVTLSGTPVVKAYLDNVTTPITGGITLDVDFNGVTGLNHLRIAATSGNGYATAQNVTMIVTTGTAGGTSVVGYNAGMFSIEARSAVRPTTAGRTLLVDASGYVTAGAIAAAAIQSIWDALTSALTTVGSIGKLIVTNLDAAISSRMATYTQPTGFLAATFPSGTVASTTNITAGTIATVTNLTNAPTNGDLTATMKTSVTTAATAATPIAASVAGNVGGDVVGTIGGLSAGAVTDVEDAVWDTAISGHLGAGSTGAALNAAGSAGDPWTTPLPGAYGAGTAGKIIGDNLDVAVSSRLATVGYTAPDNADILLIKAKTDNLPVDPAGVTNIPTATQNADALLNRDMAAVSDTNDRSPLNALRALRNKMSISGSTMTVTKENDVTTAWVAALSTDAAALPIIGVDPS